MTITIPFNRPWLGPEEAAAAAAAVASGWVSQGPEVAAFEQEFAAIVHSSHAIAVTSCTTALHLALLSLGLQAGDEVVVPSLSFIATANAVRYTGATPVFADVDEVTGTVTAKTVAAVLTPRTRSVVVVHQAGMPADLDDVRGITAPLGLPLVEDAACALGSTYKDQPVGHGSPLAAWSFHPRKLVTTGEGGMLTLEDGAVAQRLQRLRQHGMDSGAHERASTAQPVLESYLELGYNYRLTDMQAAVGRVQLGRLRDMVTRRRHLADRYRWLLRDVEGLELPADPPYGSTNYQSYVMTLTGDFPASRNELMQFLHDRGVATRRGIMAAHLEPAYRDVAFGDLTVTERLAADSLTLPLFHEMTEEQQDHVARAVRDAGRDGRRAC